MTKRPKRSTETSMLIRMSRAEKEAIEAAALDAAKNLPDGARLPTYAFALATLLERAKAMGHVPKERGKAGR
jgi:hypothetical protein